MNSCINYDDIDKILKATAEDIYGLYDNDDFIGLAGAGRADAYEAVTLANGRFDYHVTSDEEWTNETYNAIRDVLTIEEGISLTITGKLYMAADAKIIVKRGGKLVIDGGTITNMCGDLWQGIEVWGVGSSTAHPSLSSILTGAYPVDNEDHGVVLIKNGSTISFARNAITTSKYDEIGNAGYRGGIIIAYNSFFLNNKRSAEFMQFDHSPTNTDDDNISRFYGCDFQVNSEYPCEEDFACHISMWDVDGLEMIGCTFEDYRTSCKNDAKGIYSIDATYNIASDYCGGALPCDPKVSSFQGFYRAIEVDNAISVTRNIFVDKVVFSNNQRGILLSNVHNSLIMNNEFSIPDHDAVNCYGIYAEDCTNYQIENNDFHSFGIYDEQSPYNAGVYIVNNSSSYTELYRNFFENLEAGVRVQTNNLHLQIKCNTFSSEIRRHNIYVTNTGILGQQGQCLNTTYSDEERVLAPAGNIFSHDCIGSEGDFKLFDGHGPMDYKYHNDTDYELDCYTDDISTYVLPDNCTYGDVIGIYSACPSQLPYGGSPYRLDGSSIISAYDLWVELEKIYESITDLEELIENSEYELEYNSEEISYDEDFAYLEHEKNMLLISASNLYLLENKIDSALLVLAQENSDWAGQKRVEINLLSGNFSAANSELTNLNLGNVNNSDFVSLYSLLIDIASEERTIFELEVGEMESLETLAGKQSPSGVAAENILTFLTGVDYPEVFDEEVDEEDIKYADLDPNSVYIYPNPASNTINIDLSAYATENSCVVVIYDVTGINIYKSSLYSSQNNSININSLASGVYLISVLADNDIIKSEKIIKE